MYLQYSSKFNYYIQFVSNEILSREELEIIRTGSRHIDCHIDTHYNIGWNIDIEEWCLLGCYAVKTSNLTTSILITTF
jgi:hypothetical protein